jgi:HPt (histidine-containing phosphotransfer) domain-containing protein
MSSEFTTARDLDPSSLQAIAKVLGEAETGALLLSLIEGLEAALGPMRQALEAGDLTVLGRLAHKHAGGCGSLGAMNLQDRLRRIERLSQQSQRSSCEAELAAMPGLVEQLKAAVHMYLRLSVMTG